MSTKRLVMIVEDEASIRNLISTLLISNDYAVVTAENGHSVSDVFEVGGLRVDFGKRVVSAAGKDTHLTQIEFKILALLCKDAGRVLTYEYICRNVWGPYSSRDNQILRVNVANIRRKIEKNPAQPRYILTEVGVGYRLVEELKDEGDL